MAARAAYETLLSALGFSSLTAFSTFVRAEAPADYLDDNPAFYGCNLAGSKIIMVIFAVMMMGEGYSMAGQPSAVHAPPTLSQVPIARNASAQLASSAQSSAGSTATLATT